MDHAEFIIPIAKALFHLRGWGSSCMLETLRLMSHTDDKFESTFNHLIDGLRLFYKG